jgi:putative ATP-binding cassette transporter
MQIFNLLLHDGRTVLPRFAITSGLASITNAAILMIVNFAAKTEYGTPPDAYLLVIFLVAILVFSFTQRRAFQMATQAVETTVHRVRTRLLDLIRRCELLSIEAVGEARILGAMTGEAQTLSQAMNQTVIGFQAVLVTIVTGIYIAYLSWIAFALWALSVVVASLLFLRRWGASQQLLMSAAATDDEFQNATASLLHGFKEVKLSRRRATALYDEIWRLADRVRTVKIEAQGGMNSSFVFAQVLFFLLIGTMVFLVPAFDNVSRDTLSQAITAVLFVLGPVSNIIAAVPALSMAEAAAVNLHRLEEALDDQVAAEAGMTRRGATTVTPPTAETDPWQGKQFQSLELAGVAFRYPETATRDGFALGPIDLTVRAGETLFITGGNGAGKSTFLRLLTGLYRPTSGVVRMNGIAVDPSSMQSFRDRIAAVFSDYFLFKKLYGLDYDPTEADGWLEEMEIAGKTAIADGSIENTQLSTGQRKRLAFIASVLEGKPLLVLDEWAADQDPHFRPKFYETILPSLKRRGMTVIAATHDDRWFDIADREIRLADGRIVTDREL